MSKVPSLCPPMPGPLLVPDYGNECFPPSSNRHLLSMEADLHPSFLASGDVQVLKFDSSSGLRLNANLRQVRLVLFFHGVIIENTFLMHNKYVSCSGTRFLVRSLSKGPALSYSHFVSCSVMGCHLSAIVALEGQCTFKSRFGSKHQGVKWEWLWEGLMWVAHRRRHWWFQLAL